MQIAAAVFSAVSDFPWDGRSRPDLGRLLSPALADAHLSAGELQVGQHCWRCTPDSSEYGASDNSTGDWTVPGGVVRVPDAPAKARKRLTESLALLAPAFRVGVQLLDVFQTRLAAAEYGAEIGRLRRAAAADMDAQRRRLERDLHDGAQNELVALKLVMAALSAQVSGGQPVTAAAMLRERLASSAHSLSRAASGIAPTELHEDGLLAALHASAPPSDRLTLEPGSVPPRRYPAPVEVAAHYVALEAITNALKHAGGALVTVQVIDSYAGLEFVVADRGPGIDEAAASASLRYLRERAGAVGGSLQITSTPQGTTIRGLFPV